MRKRGDLPPEDEFVSPIINHFAAIGEAVTKKKEPKKKGGGKEEGKKRKGGGGGEVGHLIKLHPRC